MPLKKQRLLLGAHMSIAGGFYKAIKEGESIGCSAIQIFTKSNRQWQAKPIIDADAKLFQTTLHESKIVSYVCAHASYLINLGSPDAHTAKKSVHALHDEILRCEQLGISHLVVHPGSSLGTTEEECLKRIAENLDLALQDTNGTTQILLETMAGQGHVTCHRFEQIATIYSHVKHKNRIGVCLDTCHIFAAGYIFETPAQYKNLWKEFDMIIGRDLLKLIHINDSQKGPGSHVDRHEHIGKGKIGISSFELLMNDPELFSIPKILETPKATVVEDLKNMKTLITLLDEKSRKQLEILEITKETV